VKLPTLPNLEGLIRLARQDGVDVRPTLVRVLTDMYVQKSGHTRDEERRFTELALWLLSTVDSATRSAVATKLATYPEAPRAVIRRLADDDFAVAEPVLRQSPCLTSEDLLAITVERGSRHADTIGQRRLDLGAVPRSSPESYDGTSDPAEAIGTAPDEPGTDRSKLDAAATESRRMDNADAPAGRDASTIGRRFLDSGSGERRLILENLADASLAGATQAPSPTPEAIVRLEAAALEERPDDFARDLQDILQISRSRAQEIVRDPSGEPVVVVAEAIGMPADVLLRILLFLNPAVGQSVERVFDLVELHYHLTPQAALALVADWRDSSPVKRRTARHQPFYWDDEARMRRPALDHAWRASSQTPDGRIQTGRATEGSGTDRRQRRT
jgi:hypothetical protein